MHIWDWLYLGLPIFLTILLGFAVAGARPNWPVWRSSLLSAAILPVPILALCAWLFVSVLLSPAEKCGVDACGMAAMAAMFVGSGALALFLIGWALNFAIQKYLGRG
ncbi:hypothetical protein [Sphingomonas sp. KR3-1]|uniref:hypothetical protein n=1 Tax=Sphingomonas sp. KR3-1 TaxID=3156611 RepID=UPI0032B61965